MAFVFQPIPFWHLVEIKDITSTSAPQGPKGFDDKSDNETKPEPEILGEKVPGNGPVFLQGLCIYKIYRERWSLQIYT